ncbi:MAG: bifunctional (p)ppGpp synthetase/guanosine-3',5'-bis(diphosphate) 3'-pyrophosphohydrolase [Oscillochloris sp.]|nr:bifunctional (p)ppGpp synthetase/guanosine-3',5'-bis(diphosphate) 3'-pyrophosphohydrolase [Oscillochloris sp.]
MNEYVTVLRALEFAAERHSEQRRKDAAASPYVNHLIAVAHILAAAGSVNDSELLAAAALHDAVEDTGLTMAELAERFGPVIAGLVAEVTDDKSLPKAERKRLQEEHAPHLSARARQLKIADKISNLRDVTEHPPADWSFERRREYMHWCARVVNGCRGVNPGLDAAFDDVYRRAEAVFGGRG